MTVLTTEDLEANGEPAPRCVAVPLHHASELRRIHGQLGHIIAMVEAGRGCADIVLELADTSKALRGNGFKIIAAGLRQCISSSDAPADRQDDLTAEQLEKLLLSLA